jgi:hypothetical protein
MKIPRSGQSASKAHERNLPSMPQWEILSGLVEGSKRKNEVPLEEGGLRVAVLTLYAF